MQTATLDASQAEPRHARFVGRALEIERFQAMLAERPDAPRVLWVHGPGGVGKTTLAHELAFQARQAGVEVIRVDGRDLEPTPEAFSRAAAREAARTLVLVDTYEELAPLDRWLRDVWLPALPRGVTVVLLGRYPPAVEWRTDAGWEGLLAVTSLGNFDAREIASYLERRGIPAERHAAVAAFTRGHPLALAIAADALLQRPGQELVPEENPDVLEPLLRRLVGGVPSEAHREALELCALSSTTNEALLQALVREGDAPALFRWLRGLACIELGPAGLYPHELAREVLSAELRWRNPERYRELTLRLTDYVRAQLDSADEANGLRWSAQLIYLSRRDPNVGSFMAGTVTPGLVVESASVRDVPALLAMVERHEGAASARIAERWLQRCRNAVVARNAGGREPVGFLIMLALDQSSAGELEFDPCTQACWSFLEQQAPLRPGEHASLVRFWLTVDGQLRDSPALSAVGAAMVNYYATTPGLAYSFIAAHDVEAFQPFATFSDFEALDLTWEIGERRFAAFGKDWRLMPQAVWLARMRARAAGLDPDRATAPEEPVATPSALSREDFAAATRLALTHLHEPHLLGGNPLLQSRMVTRSCARNASTAARIEALRAIIRETAEPLRSARQTERGYRALVATYLEPAGTQEQVAELLDLPFSTYRRHLARAVEALAELLWHREESGGVG